VNDLIRCGKCQESSIARNWCCWYSNLMYRSRIFCGQVPRVMIKFSVAVAMAIYLPGDPPIK